MKSILSVVLKYLALGGSSVGGAHFSSIVDSLNALGIPPEVSTVVAALIVLGAFIYGAVGLHVSPSPVETKVEGYFRKLGANK